MMLCQTCSYLTAGDTFCCNAFHSEPVANCPDYELSGEVLAIIHDRAAVPYYVVNGRKHLAIDVDEIMPVLNGYI